MCVSESTWKVLSNGIGFISLRLMKRKWQECKDNYANWQITITTFFARKLQIAIDLIFSKVPRQIFLPIFNRNTPCNYWPQGTGSRGRQACILITRWHQRCEETLWAKSKKAHEMKCYAIIMKKISMVMFIFLFLGTSQNEFIYFELKGKH